MLQATTLSANGPAFSRLVAGVMKWGVWGANLDASAMLCMIEGSLSLGISTFDHADIYGHYTTEKTFGDALKQAPSLRQQMQLVTKCGIRMITPNRPAHRIKSYDTSRAHIISSVEQSLHNLHTDYLDLLLLHRPDPLLDPAEVAETFHLLKEQGKVLHFGVSNFSVSQMEMLAAHTDLVTNQVEASLVYLNPFQDGVFDHCLQKGIRPMAWSPLGGGDLFQQPGSEQVQRIRKAAQPIEERYGLQFDQVLLAWLLRHPAGILPVLGTSKLDRIELAAASLDVELEREEWFALLEAATGYEVA